jgi:hypothetical protein
VIENVKPESADAGNSVTITGTGFGESGKVTFNGKEATVKTGDWTATKIIAIVPVGATSGNVVVNAGGADSIGRAFTIKAECDQSAFEVVTGVGAEVAGGEVTSYKVDTTNNALSQTNVGRKTVEILLGGGFIVRGRGVAVAHVGESVGDGAVSEAELSSGLRVCAALR